jgi:hypothetical protein
MKNVICPYCNKQAELVSSREIFRRNYDKLYLCRGCQAWVGSHPDTDEPKGTLAKEPLRILRQRVHKNFDKMWKGTDFPHKKRGIQLAKLLKGLIGFLVSRNKERNTLQK